MSGLITGPYFKSYFDDPDAVTLGTMVAILEVGAFRECVVYCMMQRLGCSAYASHISRCRLRG
jgi:hypothetical protein